jgi:NADPH:quinone reductase-like Zn-dependent oxidoreductase
MNVVELHVPNLNGFRKATRPDLEPRFDEVLVRLRAATLNYLDIAVATGRLPGLSFPKIPVADGAGEVVRVGESVTEWKVGDRVIPHSMPYWTGGAITPEATAGIRGVTLPGSLADYVVVPAGGLAAIPSHLDFEQAATLPIAATTAWNALRVANIRPGSTVLLLGTGGVSLFALQLAKASGATVVLASSSDEKLAHGRSLGADHTVNYRSDPDWDAFARTVTDGRGVDLVVETVGPATMARSVNAVAHGGTIFVIGFLSGINAELNLLSVMTKQIRVQGNSTGSVADLRDAVRASGAHRIVPIVSERFSWTEIQAAYEHVAGGSHWGKVAVIPA